MPLYDLIALCDSAVPATNGAGGRQESFNLPALAADIMRLPDLGNLLPGLDDISHRIPPSTFLHHFRGIIRTAFFIESVVPPAATATRFRTRWRLEGNDPRYSTPDNCLEIARRLITLLQPLLKSETGQTILNSLALHSMIPYELPVTYSAHRLPIHTADNFSLIDDDLLRHATGCRLLLLKSGTPHLMLFKAAYAKIRVKTYLTDRAVTGTYKTNREKRWEAHPNSVQFALRSTCMQIERVLVNQLIHFDGFPREVRSLLDDGNLLLPLETPTRCPVTLLPMSLARFEEAVTNPQHGRSPFQVGHRDPLKLEGNVWSNGHRPNNISWISEDGNRIQGSLSLQETREMLQRIWQAYSEAGLL